MEKHRFFAHVPATMLRGFLPTLDSLPIGLEILIDHDALRPEFRGELESLGEHLRARNCPCRFHAPFRDINPGGFDPDVLAITRKRLTDALGVAKLFDVRDLVVHTNWDPRTYGLDREAWLKRSLSFWRHLEPELREAGGRFALENVFDGDPSILAALMDGLPEDCYAVNFDVGHHLAWADCPLGDWFDILGERLLSLHLHDNKGLHDEHLAVGAGAMDWSELFIQAKRLGRPLDWTVENRSMDDVLASARLIGAGSGQADLAYLAELALR